MGYRNPNDWQEQLQASLRRAQEAIARGTTQQDQMVREWTENLRNAYPDWGRERWQRRLERKLRRRAEREAKVANASLFEGYLWLLGAIVLFIIALSSLPFLWWLIFPAAGLGSRGTRVIARHSRMTQPILTEPHPARASSATGATAEQQRAQRFGSLSGIGKVFDGDPIQQPAPARGAAVQQDPRDVRVDAICDRILGELRTSPDAVKDIFVKRINGESDDVTKMRLAAALAALDAQRDQRVELARAAARFDAEHTRISYTLESLHTQVVRMRSADSSSVDVAGAGLRRSLDMLSHEVNALADALERVNSGEAERMRKVASGPGGESGAVPPGEPGKREKA